MIKYSDKGGDIVQKNRKYIISFLVLLMCFIIVYCVNNKNVLIDDEQVALGGFMYEVSKDTVSNANYLLSGNADVNDKVYYVDAPTMLSLAQNKNIQGNGYIRWDGWKALSKENILSGNLKVNYINDEIYTSMKLPSEVSTYLKWRVNPEVIKYQPSGYINTLGIGSIYPVTGAELPDNFNIYLGKLKTFVLMAGENEQWKVIDSHKCLDSDEYYSIHYLPWQLHKYEKISHEKIEIGSDYVKFNFTKEDLNSKVLHFWGTQKPCISEQAIGMVTIYEVWSDTPDITGKLAAAIGIDQRNAKKEVQQAFSGRNYAVTNSKRLVIGHNMPDDVYDWCVANGKSPQVCLDLFYQD